MLHAMPIQVEEEAFHVDLGHQSNMLNGRNESLIRLSSFMIPNMKFLMRFYGKRIKQAL